MTPPRNALRLLTQREAARMLRVRPATVAAWMASGELASRRSGPTNRGLRTTLAAIEAFNRFERR